MCCFWILLILQVSFGSPWVSFKSTVEGVLITLSILEPNFHGGMNVARKLYWHWKCSSVTRALQVAACCWRQCWDLHWFLMSFCRQYSCTCLSAGKMQITPPQAEVNWNLLNSQDCTWSITFHFLCRLSVPPTKLMGYSINQAGGWPTATPPTWKTRGTQPWGEETIETSMLISILVSQSSLLYKSFITGLL